MSTPRPVTKGAPHGFLFRLIAFLTRFQLGRLLRSTGNRQVVVLLFAMSAGALSLATITAAALWTRLPLLFPPLAPSAFILFVTPLTPQASPRSVVLAHTFAVLVGTACLHAVARLLPAAGLLDPAVMNWARVLVIGLTMGGITVLMTLLRCAHPPAAASALIAAMGYLSQPIQALGLILAACLLVLEAIALNRYLGGLPYPLWRPDPRAAHGYGILAGQAGNHGNYWQQLSERLLQSHPPGRA